jgi:phosphotriesterase-related protein
LPEDGVVAMLPDWHHGFVQQSLIPGLLENGVTEEQVDQMMRQNPVRFFSARAGAADEGGTTATAAARG